MSTPSHQIKKRLEYTKPDFMVSDVDLTFNLEPNDTRVVCKKRVVRQGNHTRPLVLDGHDLILEAILVNQKEFTDYIVNDQSLTLNYPGDDFELIIETRIDPANNSSLEGLYLSSGAYCTQCEAEGFRKITYFLDRPDILAEYRVKIIADQKKYPFILCNGNKTGEGILDSGHHWVEWHDPYKKPCYLFALVAGDFDLLEDEFTTQSGRPVLLQLFVDKGKLSRGQHALDSLKKAMDWDEKVFGLEYDLDIYMIVAVDFFNMGAMENKGLNVFNSKFVLADPQSATDEDYFNIESVIAHEYFHNWTGNRVTCRDWFQLSLKEGLTVFRDQQFSADMSSPVVNRIKNVRIIREHQFAEDASAMSHPIRPDEVMEMNNFYTVTVYDKGAEVIRMIHTLLGIEGFRKGMDLYFERFDGQAVTCDDFVQSMQDASGVDLSQFKHWYAQSGTPIVKVNDTFNKETGDYHLVIEQINKPTSDQQQKVPLHIPIKFELLQNEGGQISIPEKGLVNLKQEKQTLDFSVKGDKPTPVVLNNFSAPVKLDYNYTSEELRNIAQFSQDPFSKWDACQSLFSQTIHGLANDQYDIEDKQQTQHILALVNDCHGLCASDPALAAEMLSIPSFEALCQQVSSYDVDKLFNARQVVQKFVANQAEKAWLTIYQTQPAHSYHYQKHQVDSRRIKNLCLSYLALTERGNGLVEEHYNVSDNMTDTLGALKAAQQADINVFDRLMQDFEQKWQHDPLVLDKWFGLHANAKRDDILARINLLTGHKQFNLNNPNRVRALIGSFTFFNPTGFHAIDGSGYRFITDYLLELDKINPQVSARIVTPLTQWQRLDETRQEMMRLQLARLMNEKSLSNDLYEKVSKSLSYTGN